MDQDYVRVNIYKNSTKASDRKAILLDKSQDRAAILQEIGNAIGINAVKVYNSAGADIFSNLQSVKDNDDLYVSQGENFQKLKVEKRTESVFRKANICILGEGAVGKSCITLQYVKHYFEPNYDPTIQEAFDRVVTINDSAIAVNILDTAGWEDYLGLVDQWILNKDGFVLVYSVASNLAPQTDASIRTFMRRIENRYNMADKATAPVVVLAANMIDVPDRTVTKDWGQKLAADLGITYFETSAKTNTNIEPMFHHILSTLKDNREPKVVKTKKWYEKLCTLL